MPCERRRLQYRHLSRLLLGLSRWLCHSYCMISVKFESGDLWRRSEAPMPGMRGNLRGIDGFESLSFGSVDEFVVDEQSCSMKLACFSVFGRLRLLIRFSVWELNLRKISPCFPRNKSDCEWQDVIPLLQTCLCLALCSQELYVYCILNRNLEIGIVRLSVGE
jgi:hypothetical protein